jgi:hypothetical protein
MQVWDILRAIEWITAEEKVPASSLALYGKREMGILALYAGLFDPRVEKIVLRDPVGTHVTGPGLLNVLRVTDIPEVAAAFAPRELVVVGELPATLEYARGVYKFYERPGALSQAGSLPEALEVWKY